MAKLRSTSKARSDVVVAMKPYAMGTAARLAGIPPETLRIWERRYHMLDPGRTGGGHRLFSEHDVAVLRAAKRLVDSGMRIGAVAALPPDQIIEEAARLPAPASDGLLQGSAALVDEIIDAARALDNSAVAALLDRPRLLTDPLDVVTSLYLPLLHRVGELWHQGALPVGVEHFVEKHVTARVHAILQSTKPPAAGRLALCACPSDERHEVGLLAAAVALKAGGTDVTLLGADVPAADLAEAANVCAPSLVVLGVTNALSSRARRELPRALETAPLAALPLIVGGPNASELVDLLRRQVEVVHEIAQISAAVARLL